MDIAMASSMPGYRHRSSLLRAHDHGDLEVLLGELGWDLEVPPLLRREEFVGDVAYHVVGVVAHNLAPGDLARDLVRHVGPCDDGLDVLVGVVLVLLLIDMRHLVVGGRYRDPAAIQSLSLR
jgi:hypothetical protein